MPSEVRFTFEGQRLSATPGTTIAVALDAAGIVKLSVSRNKHRPRGAFCGMGWCSACTVLVDGERRVAACLTPVVEGMEVRRIDG
ncbi:MAG TPA: (2Fe-2S)-binding protein [Candidatus Dormibacteraeota bacterium]|nr:(2Fe-2S)-binding protein [Candidatus Dormibacteraeota bacterium]